MLQAGTYAQMTVEEFLPQGAYLLDQDNDRVLLPNRQIPEGTQVGDSLKVFIYLDSEDRYIATLQRPRIQLHQIACLTVADVNRTGAFLDWGLPKDLFVPFAEQQQRMEVGKSYVVYLTEDNTGRLIATSKLNRYIKDKAVSTGAWQEEGEPLLKNGEAVKLLIAQRTDLGYKAVVNNLWWGVLHNDDIRTAIKIGMKLDGFVKRVRDDGKLDLTLEAVGFKRTQDLSGRILKKLQSGPGIMAVSDNSPSDLIEMHFGCSKRAFKQAIGRLYKERKIIIETDSIRLASEQEQAEARKTKDDHSARKPGFRKSAEGKPAGKYTDKPFDRSGRASEPARSFKSDRPAKGDDQDKPKDSPYKRDQAKPRDNNREKTVAEKPAKDKPSNRKWMSNRKSTEKTLSLKGKRSDKE
ncbi:CvfB family protein [Oceanobacter mangrovi]|uniref:CvfB family protein n=1 Tax=Oceanobacter mangrovi TaxID=2862510 RepID=UPI001C8F007C|nr:S1-like domain-containing RNA-binding protein [Oceanobacter mangrovi]